MESENKINFSQIIARIMHNMKKLNTFQSNINQNLPGQENRRFRYCQRFPSNKPDSLSNFHVSD